MKGVILAGGKGTRLRPATLVINKHLIPILNRPMILYPLETLKRLGVLDVVVVTGGEHIGAFAEFLGDGSDFGMEITYRVQTEAGGIAQALGLVRGHVGQNEHVCVILGDNIFDDSVNKSILEEIGETTAQLFTKSVDDPERFGVLGSDNKIIEKPAEPTSNKAITGLYIYPKNVFDFIENLRPSDRGELEITDINNQYLKEQKAVVTDLGSSFWSDAGTPESLARTTEWVLNLSQNH